MRVPIEQGLTELNAHNFKRDNRQHVSGGECWITLDGDQILFLHYLGPDKDCFDSEQLAFV